MKRKGVAVRLARIPIGAARRANEGLSRYNGMSLSLRAPPRSAIPGRNLMRGPSIANFDFGFFKATAITEKTRLELRFEFYNLFNHTQFNPNGMDTDISSSDFGRISQARDPRVGQLAAKFYF